MNGNSDGAAPVQNRPTAANGANGARRRALHIAVGRRVKARAHLLLGAELANLHYNEDATSKWEYGEVLRSAGRHIWAIKRDFDRMEVNMTRRNVKVVPDGEGFRQRFQIVMRMLN